MRCPRCDYVIRGHAFFCPNCGAKLEEAQQSSSPATQPTLPPDWVSAPSPAPSPLFKPSATPPPSLAGKGSSLTWMVIGGAVLVLLLILGLGYAGVKAGQRERAQRIENTAEDLYRRGENYLKDGQLELAEAAFEQALLYMPDHKRASEGLAQVRAQLGTQPTATPLLQRETKQAYWNELMAAYETHAWDLVIQQADRLIEVDPEYNRDQVNEMLVEAFYELGQSLVAEDKMVEATRNFESALVIEPDNERINLARDLATGYMSGMGYWGADWPQTIANLRQVYALDPTYKDVASRLFSAMVQYGDLLIERQQWCEASQQYTQALEISSNADTVAKNQDATLKCAQTPTPNPEGAPTAKVPVPSGTFVGRVARVEDVASGQLLIRGQVLNAKGAGVGNVLVRIQAFDWSATAISDGSGQFSFDGLANAVVYTLSLPDLPSQAVDVNGQWGKLNWVEFVETE